MYGYEAHFIQAHVPLAYVPEAKHVLVIGGGDGGALWRLLQHENIETAELIDIDLEVCRLRLTLHLALFFFFSFLLLYVHGQLALIYLWPSR